MSGSIFLTRAVYLLVAVFFQDFNPLFAFFIFNPNFLATEFLDTLLLDASLYTFFLKSKLYGLGIILNSIENQNVLA